MRHFANRFGVHFIATIDAKKWTVIGLIITTGTTYKGILNRIK
jgi:hypothetical protein